MSDPLRKYFPQHWDEVPSCVYDPAERLFALDKDGVDAEVLFPNEPALGGTFLQASPEFELDCVRAYNDWLAEWRAVSDRFIPLALIPYLSGPVVAVQEITRAVAMGHRGVNMLAEPNHTLKDLPHFNDPAWDQVWAVCQDLNVPIHWHAGGGLHHALSMPIWEGFDRSATQAVAGAFGFSIQAQAIPNLLFSGVLDRFPKLKWVCAESGLGWVLYILEASDHEWEKRRLWKEGFLTRPSELFKRQVFVDFWYERIGVKIRDTIGIGNIMWESDFPHSTSTYPDSWKFIERSLDRVPDDDKAKLLWENAVSLYGLEFHSPGPPAR